MRNPTNVYGKSNCCMCCVLLWKIGWENVPLLTLKNTWYLLHIIHFLAYPVKWNKCKNQIKYSQKTTAETAVNTEENKQNSKWGELQGHTDCPTSFDELLNFNQSSPTTIIKRQVLITLAASKMQVKRRSRKRGKMPLLELRPADKLLWEQCQCWLSLAHVMPMKNLWEPWMN